MWFGQPHASLVPKTKMKSIIQRGGISHTFLPWPTKLNSKEKRVTGSVRDSWPKQTHALPLLIMIFEGAWKIVGMGLDTEESFRQTVES